MVGLMRETFERLMPMQSQRIADWLPDDAPALCGRMVWCAAAYGSIRR
jgi:hypothetical protein